MESAEPAKRRDLLTGEEFIPKKITQRFTTPQNRIKYNNLKASQEKQNIAFYNKPLLKNYRILLELVGKNKSATYSRDYLLGSGFNFSIFNHFSVIEGRNYPSVNEFTLVIQKENPNIKIIKND